MAFLLVVMATLLLQSGNVERNPGPTVVGKAPFYCSAKIYEFRYYCYGLYLHWQVYKWQKFHKNI